MSTILVIEDNDNNLYLTRYILEHNGFNVIDAQNGIDGVKKAFNEKPDIIIMDIQLPDINGYEATKRIRESEIDGGIPIIALTSYAMTGDREKALEAGCTGYIEKPINPETFLSEISKFLNTQQEDGEVQS
ncbi:response regulator [bacterium]|nr:response regulator [bacterium]